MAVEQLDLFADIEPIPASMPIPTGPALLNGMYYERATDKFVSFVLGERYYEELAKGCGHPKDWQDRTRRDRAL